MRIAIYARYSTEHQNFKSTADQTSDCQKFISDHFQDYEEPVVFSDSALSGQHAHRRSGYQQLLAAIRAREFDVVVAEGLDRLSRNLTDIDQLYKIAKFRKIEIQTIAEGKISPLHIGLKGTMNEMYTSSVALQVKRSQRNRALEGKMFGIPYGYKIKIRNGREIAGEREIDEEKAKVVREIFGMFADGHSIPSIVQYLNVRKIPSPRNKLWTKHSIMGSKERMEGMLNNRIYIGDIVWNRRSLKINPETGGVNYPINDKSEWVVTHNEDLRIVADNIWDKCEAIKTRKKTQKKRPTRVINSLRGLLFCGVCKGYKNIANNKRYVCGNYRQYRTCKNARGMNYHSILIIIFNALEEDLEKKVKNKSIYKIFNNNIPAVADSSKKDLEGINYTINQLVSNIGERGVSIPEITDHIEMLHKKRMDIEKSLISKQDHNFNNDVNKTLHDGLGKLKENLSTTQTNDDNRIRLLALVKSVIFIPTSKRTGEHTNVQLCENGWPDFYHLIKNDEKK